MACDFRAGAGRRDGLRGRSVGGGATQAEAGQTPALCWALAEWGPTERRATWRLLGPVITHLRAPAGASTASVCGLCVPGSYSSAPGAATLVSVRARRSLVESCVCEGWAAWCCCGMETGRPCRLRVFRLSGVERFFGPGEPQHLLASVSPLALGCAAAAGRSAGRVSSSGQLPASRRSGLIECERDAMASAGVWWVDGCVGVAVSARRSPPLLMVCCAGRRAGRTAGGSSASACILCGAGSYSSASGGVMAGKRARSVLVVGGCRQGRWG
jgi:hypothetical protein